MVRSAASCSFRRELGFRRVARASLRLLYAAALRLDTGATFDDLREALTTLEEIGRTAERVLGGRHPTTEEIEGDVERSRAALRARETPPLP